jgi:hypothetical protein
VPLRLQIVQKPDDQIRIKLLEMQLRWRDLQTTAGICEEQLECVGVGVTGVDTGATFDGKAFLKKRRDMRCD